MMKAEAASSSKLQAVGKRRVLVVDDEPKILLVFSRALKNEFEIITAKSGKEAMRILEGGDDFDLVLCDMMMDDASGVDLYEWIEKRSPKLVSKIAFISGGSFTPRAAQFLRRVDNRLIEKPFEPNDLKALVNDLIAQAGA